MFKRYIVEFGTGVDHHTGNATKAAKKAVMNAMDHSCCLSGIKDTLGVKDFNKSMLLKIKIGSPDPEKIDKDEVRSVIPFGTVEIEAVEGGLVFEGLYVPSLGESRNIIMANAAITVYVDSDR